MFRYSPSTAALILVGILSTRPATTQILYGGLVGQVRDSSDAAIPGAQVTVTSAETDVSRSTMTNLSGIFSLPTLGTGTYTLRVEAQGFSSFVKTGIQVTVNNVTRADVNMELGQVTTSDFSGSD